MPSATDYGFVNLGPLTTTFTAAPSCPTDTGYFGVAPATAIPGFLFLEHCSVNFPQEGCIPSGGKHSEILASKFAATASVDFLTEYYYSPGLYCPESYTTVGMMVMDGEGDIASVTGIYDIDGWTDAQAETATSAGDAEVKNRWKDDIRFEPLPNLWMRALKPNETAIACCPSGFEGSNWGGDCVKTFEIASYTASTVCWQYYAGRQTKTRLFTFEDEVFTEQVVYWTEAPSGSTEYDTYATSRGTNYVAKSVLPMMTLVHSAEDVTQTAESDSGGDEGDEESDEGDEASGSLTFGSSVAIMAAVWGVAAIAGAALMA